MKIAIVTGASSGMGREFVKQISENYKCLDEIWVIGRNADKLCDVQKDVRIKLRILPMNLRKKEAMERLRHALDTRQPRIKILVNCAGMGVIGDFSQLSLNAQRETVRLNCEALTAVTYVCLPYMHRRTRIIQMSSASAFVPQPGFAIYAASKSYVLSRTERQRDYRHLCMPGTCGHPILQTCGKNRSDACLQKMDDGSPGRCSGKGYPRRGGRTQPVHIRMEHEAVFSIM